MGRIDRSGRSGKGSLMPFLDKNVKIPSPNEGGVYKCRMADCAVMETTVKVR